MAAMALPLVDPSTFMTKAPRYAVLYRTTRTGVYTENREGALFLRSQIASSSR